MKQVIIKGGQGRALSVAKPRISDYEILVRTAFSFVSVGTESASIRNTGKPLWRRALENPSEVTKLLGTISSLGFSNAQGLVKGRLADGNEAGYSCAGTVVAVGKSVDGFKLGDEVACAGAGVAMHAQYVAVPEHLAALKPRGLSLEQASTVAVGAIALNAVRRAKAEQGDVVFVIGLGLLGNLTSQLLLNAGCRVVAIDPALDKTLIANRLRNVEAFCDLDQAKAALNYYSRGQGADSVIVAAASESDDIVSMAFDCCRKKGKVVIVGDVGLALRRNDFYKKEIDFLIATSYGPGRYDESYERFGIDYPYAFVRWTENRNMQLYLELIEQKAIDVNFLIENIFSINDATAAYQSINDKNGIVSVLFDHRSQVHDIDEKRIWNVAKIRSINREKVSVGIIGAGSFCRGMHLPNLNKLQNLYQIAAVANKTGNKARSVVEQYKALYSTTDYRELLDDDNIDAVIISTRHDSHSEIVSHSLLAGKHVFVEKPLALTRRQLESVMAAYANSPSQVLMVGFNRRFCSAMQRVTDCLRHRKSPLAVQYIVNAGNVSPDHWLNAPGAGSRNLGEACHMYDLLTYITQSRYKRVTTSSIGSSAGMYSWRDNFTATIDFEDGSVCSLTYTSMGNNNAPKEEIKIFSEGTVLSVIDFKKLRISKQSRVTEDTLMGKGHLEEMRIFGETIRSGGKLPIPIWQMVQATNIALDVEEQLQGEK